MKSGSISYSPDYKDEDSRKAWDAGCEKYGVAIFGSEVNRLLSQGVRVEQALESAARNIDHIRLEREVIDKAKEFTSNDEARDHWNALVCYRELCGAVDALLTFEAEQEKKNS